jgi:hypothetical protein
VPNCVALQHVALEATVNRLVAGSNPARGANISKKDSIALGSKAVRRSRFVFAAISAWFENCLGDGIALSGSRAFMDVQ